MIKLGDEGQYSFLGEKFGVVCDRRNNTEYHKINVAILINRDSFENSDIQELLSSLCETVEMCILRPVSEG